MRIPVPMKPKPGFASFPKSAFLLQDGGSKTKRFTLLTNSM